MSYKPSDFYLGVVDLLGILAPGAFITFALPPDMFDDFGIRPTASATWDVLHSVMFLLLAYVLGNFIHFAGAFSLNPVYKRLYFPRKMKQHGTFWRAAERAAGDLCAIPFDDPLRLADAFLRLHYREVTSEIDRREATSKFFRGVALVSLAFAVVASWHDEWGRGIGYFVVAVLCFVRFCNQRWKRDLVTYELFALVQYGKGSIPAVKRATGLDE